ncbi:MAG: TrmH family RNA methyltransferase [Bdellovibrionota bacterium]
MENPGLAPRYRVILVEPRTPGNVGAVARACACFGIQDLRLVKPACDHLGFEATKYATGPSGDLLQSARVEPNLASAIADCTAAIAFTRRTGDDRRQNLKLTEIPALLAGSKDKIALVFGNEETGLHQADVQLCTQLCSIGTAREMGSLNLSHAVAIVLSWLFDRRPDESREENFGSGGGGSSALLGQMAGLFTHIEEFLIEIGLNRSGNPERLMRHLRRVLQRTHLRSREVRLLRGIVSKAQVALRNDSDTLPTL